MHLVFDFEDEGVHALTLMSYDLRRKLDLAGLKLSLAAWQALPKVDRQRLAEMPGATHDDIAAFGAAVRAAAARVALPPTEQPPVTHRPWNEPANLINLIKAAMPKARRIDPEALAAVSETARYALYRLAEPRKKSDRLVEALRILELIDA